MKSSCRCECHEYETPCKPKIHRTCPNTQNTNCIDFELSSLKSEIAEKLENLPDYSELELKFRQLEDDVQNLSEEKLQIEYELRQAGKGCDKSILDLQLENENLLKEIDERNIMIEKLYMNNNNLYSDLDNQIKDNQCLQKKLITQNDVLQQINNDRKKLENNLNNLNNLKNQDFCDIQNLKEQIDCYEKENINNDIELNKINEINNKCIDEINEEECLKEKLEKILEEKDNEMKEKTEELKLVNDTLKRIGNDFNNLNIENNENEENINLYDENLLKESEITEEVLNKNKQLNDLIKEKENEIDELKNENNIENNNLNYINQDVSLLDNKIEEYKRHIINLSNMNEKLSKELEAIINRDEQMRYNVLNRVEYLNCLKEDNKNIINLSLKNITNFMQNNGNKGCYIKVDNTNNKNIKNKNNKNMINKKNKFYSFKDKNENEDEENYEEQYSNDQE